MAYNDDPETALEDIDNALEQIEEIEDDYPQVWDRGCGFLEDVREKLKDVRATIESRNTVSERQRKAINNWADGVSRWHPEHR